jgi:hypothetical protein
VTEKVAKYFSAKIFKNIVTFFSIQKIIFRALSSQSEKIGHFQESFGFPENGHFKNVQNRFGLRLFKNK